MMEKRMIFRVLLPLALLVGLVGAPASAQGKGKSNQAKGSAQVQTEARPQLERRGAEDVQYGVSGNGSGKVPPGWCQGQGNPHRTVANCGYLGVSGSNGGIGGYRTYEEAHAAFHRELDQKYRTLAAQNPLDIRRQLELRAQKSAEHQRWHDAIGRSHD